MNEILKVLRIYQWIGKIYFPLGKWNFEPTENSAHTVEFLTLGKDLILDLIHKTKL